MTNLTYQAKKLSPIIAVADITRSVAFYTEVLGFEAGEHSDDYATVRHGPASLILTKADDPSALEATRKHCSFYLEVEVIEPLWSHVSTFRDRYKLRDPFDREYGMREFHIIDPDGCLIFVGEPIPAPGLHGTPSHSD